MRSRVTGGTLEISSSEGAGVQVDDGMCLVGKLPGEEDHDVIGWFASEVCAD